VGLAGSNPVAPAPFAGQTTPSGEAKPMPRSPPPLASLRSTPTAIPRARGSPRSGGPRWFESSRPGHRLTPYPVRILRLIQRPPRQGGGQAQRTRAAGGGEPLCQAARCERSERENRQGRPVIGVPRRSPTPSPGRPCQHRTSSGGSAGSFRKRSAAPQLQIVITCGGDAGNALRRAIRAAPFRAKPLPAAGLRPRYGPLPSPRGHRRPCRTG